MTDGWSCPVPLRDHPRITMAHGGGGELGADLIEHLFLPAFGDAATDATPTDAAVLDPGPGRLAFTTDSYVVRPLFFPGGDIGELAVFGTVNDLAMAGARPVALSTAFVLDEGLELEVLDRVARSMGRAAGRAGVRLVTGDTKVVDGGPGDGLTITTAGIGVVPDGVDIGPTRARPGDAVIVSGPLGRHGTAVMSARDGLAFDTPLTSDCAPLAELVTAMIATGTDVHVLRDLTRGGLAAALCEIAEVAGVGVHYDEPSLPIPREVDAACRLLGLDPVHVANEGTLVAMVAPDDTERVLAAMRRIPEGEGATVIGTIVDEHPGRVTARTSIGGTRIVTRPLGEQLPRIC